MKIKIKNPFAKTHKKADAKSDSEHVIEQDTSSGIVMQAEGVDRPQELESKSEHKERRKISFSRNSDDKQQEEDEKKSKRDAEEIRVHERNSFEKFAYNLLSSRLPGFNEFRESYGQSGISEIFEAYISTGFLLSFVSAIPAFLVSLILEIKLFPHGSLALSLLGSAILSAVTVALVLVLWLAIPLIKRRSYKSKLEGQLAYSFGILGVLAAAGMNLERLFDRLATSESNPVMADLARRFLRNIRVFGLDTETALAEVAQHSPSNAFSKMLESIAVAHKTTGSIHDLVMFESARLLQEKRDKLRKTIGSLAVMAELYITVVVVGPIIFIVMMAIFGLLPAGGLPNPISIINLIVFIGVPVLSVMFVLLLDSVVSKA
jgi:hypothetical protein